MMWPFKPNVGKLAARHNVGALTGLLSHADPEVRRAATAALAQANTAEALDALCGLFERPDSALAEIAAGALRTIGGPDVLDRMRKLANSPGRCTHAMLALDLLVKLGDVSGLAAALSADAFSDARGAGQVSGHLEYLIREHGSIFSTDQLAFLSSLEDRTWSLPPTRLQFGDPDIHDSYEEYRVSYKRLRKVAAKELRNKRCQSTTNSTPAQG